MINNNEWRLPTKEELDKMYENLHCKRIGNFAPESYWSSSENDSNDAWGQYFYSGSQYNHGKDNSYRVRAVRTFETTYTNHYEIGQKTSEGFIFDIRDNEVSICKKQDEYGVYTWDDAMKFFSKNLYYTNITPSDNQVVIEHLYRIKIKDTTIDLTDKEFNELKSEIDRLEMK